MKIVMLSKDNEWTLKAEIFLRQLFGRDVKVFKTNEKYQKYPDNLKNISGDVLISFLSPWIIPKCVLDKFKVAINFHPGPPEYPGTGCYNFAIYEGAKTYGVTCHFMTPVVDSGDIIEVVRFPVYPSDTPESLQKRSLDFLLVLFYNIIDKICRGEKLKTTGEKWKRRPLTRKDLNALCKIDPFSMSRDEIYKRIKATFHSNPKYGPYIELFDYKFYLIDTNGLNENTNIGGAHSE